MNQPSLIQRTLFAQDSVKQLHQSDFKDLNSDTKIDIIYKDCMLVLFYGDNLESTNLATIWSVAAKNVVGPIFGACNLMVETRVAEAFSSLNMRNTSLHWAALKTIPFILVYQNGWPIAFYNGERSVQSIVDYALTLACRADYHEPENLFGGMTLSNDSDYLMKGVTQYGIQNNPFRKDSLAYSANENLRGYDKLDTIKAFGTPQEKAEAAHTLSNEEASRIGINRTTVPITAAPTPQEQQLATAQIAGQEAGQQAAAATEQALGVVPGGIRVAPPGLTTVAQPSVQGGLGTELPPPPGSSLE